MLSSKEKNILDILVDTFAENIIKSAAPDETALGEPQLWLPMPKGRSLEITHEEDGLNPEDQFFSWRIHCSNEEFDNDKFRGTMGVIDETNSDNMDDMNEIKSNLKHAIYVALTVD